MCAQWNPIQIFFLESVSGLNFTNTGKVIEREYLWLTAPMVATPVN